MEIYVSKAFEEVFSEYSSHYESTNIYVGTDFEKAKDSILNSESVIELRGIIEVWVDGERIKEIDI